MVHDKISLTYVCCIVFLVLVNFTASCYEVEVNETEATVRVAAFGEFNTDFSVNVITIAPNQPELSKYLDIHLIIINISSKIGGVGTNYVYHITQQVIF